MIEIPPADEGSITGTVMDVWQVRRPAVLRVTERIVQAEPWLERDKAMIDQLTSIGIAKSQPLNPDAKTRAVLNDAAREAHQWLVARYESSVSSPFCEGGHGPYPVRASCSKGSRRVSPGSVSIPWISVA